MDSSILKTGQPLSYCRGQSQAQVASLGLLTDWQESGFSQPLWLWLICSRNSEEYSGKHVPAWNECRDCIGSSGVSRNLLEFGRLKAFPIRHFQISYGDVTEQTGWAFLCSILSSRVGGMSLWNKEN